MSTNMVTRVCKYNEKDNLFHEIALYKLRNKDCEQYEYDEEGKAIKVEDPYIKISPFEDCNSEMFDGMKRGNEVDGYGTFPMHHIRYGSLEPSFADSILKDIKDGCFDANEINLAVFKNYCTDHPLVVDYEREEESKKKNPLVELYEDICTYCSFIDNIDFYFDPLSDYKVIFYFC